MKGDGGGGGGGDEVREVRGGGLVAMTSGRLFVPNLIPCWLLVVRGGNEGEGFVSKFIVIALLFVSFLYVFIHVANHYICALNG